MTKKHVRIVIDTSVFASGRGGIPRVTQELTNALRSISAEWNIVEARPYVFSLGRFSRLDGTLRQINYLYRYIVWNQIVLPLKSIRNNTTVIIAPNIVIPLLFARRTVPIIHDLGHKHKHDIGHKQTHTGSDLASLVGQFAYKQWIDLNIRISLAWCPVVLVSSHYVKSDILKHYRNCSADIVVVPWAPSEQLSHSERILDKPACKSTNNRFILAIGTQPRKRLDFLAKVIAELRKTIEVDLMVIGPVSRRIMRSSFAEFISFPGVVTDDELASLYENASALVMAGTSEGFGIPVLEAMAAGCPVVVSNAGSLPELVANAGIVVAAASVQEWSDSLLLLLSNEDTRNWYIERGWERAGEFSWRKSARMLADQLSRFGVVSPDLAAGHMN